MLSRPLLAILISSIATGSLCTAARAEWSPLQKDAEKEVRSVETAAELKQFHKLRQELDIEQARLQAAEKKKRGFFGKFKRAKAADPNVPVEDPDQPPVAHKVSPDEPMAAAEEPGTAPAKELVDGSEEEATEEGDEDAPKKVAKKKVPGEHPTEEVDDPAYFIKRSQSFAARKDFQSALNYVDKALELQPQNWQASYQKALVYQLAGYDAAAARRYLQIIARRPDMLEARISMGMLYRKHGNLDLAAKEYQACIDEKFYCFPAHFNLANVLTDQNKLEEALKEYKVCLKLQPNNALVHNNMGVIFQKRQYLEEAADEFRKAAHLDPANKLYSENLQNVRSQLGQRAPKNVTM